MSVWYAFLNALGIRMACSRGSMDLSVKDGGLPPDSVVQTVDEIMKDSARLIETYHDPSFGSMRQLALAPCSPFSVSVTPLVFRRNTGKPSSFSSAVTSWFTPEGV